MVLGAEVWYDEFSLRLGDSLSASIDTGLASSRYGIVVLSKAFIAKPWPQRELRWLVAREVDGRSSILPVWHNLTRQDVLEFSPTRADKVAAKTAGATAAQIAMEILSIIRPDIAGNTPYESIRKIATGEVVAELQKAIDRLRGDLKEFQCPHCGSSLVQSQEVPHDPEEKHWGTLRGFECGFADLDGEIMRPCPRDPNSPKLSDFDVQCRENPSAVLYHRWVCEAFPKTDMARLLHLPTAYGNTNDAALRELQEQYERSAHPWMRPMGITIRWIISSHRCKRAACKHSHHSIVAADSAACRLPRRVGPVVSGPVAW